MFYRYDLFLEVILHLFLCTEKNVFIFFLHSYIDHDNRSDETALKIATIIKIKIYRRHKANEEEG